MHRGIVATIVAVAALQLSSAPAQAMEDGPSISLRLTVYRGHDGGARCAGGEDFAEANQGESVTYCFTVTNTGSTHLASVVVSDPLLAGPPVLLSADSAPLAPGDSARYYVDAVPPADEADGAADDTFLNNATATALPVDAAGTPEAGTDAVLATAEAVVYPPEVAPESGVSLATSVYAGIDGGAGCPAADMTLVNAGDPITYCFTVANSGTTHLDLISFSDLGVDGAPVLLGGGSLPLAPGGTLRYYLDAVAPELPAQGYTANPMVTASPVDETGAALAGLSEASGRDGAVVEAPPMAATPPKPTKPAAGPTLAAAPTPARAEGPQQLAYTGWETWLVATAGVGLAAAGWALATSGSRRREPAVVPLEVEGRTPPDPVGRSHS